MPLIQFTWCHNLQNPLFNFTQLINCLDWKAIPKVWHHWNDTYTHLRNILQVLLIQKHVQNFNLTRFGSFPLQSCWGSSKCLVLRIPVNNLNPNTYKWNKIHMYFDRQKHSQKTKQKQKLQLTGLLVQIAEDVEGRGWGSLVGKPGEVGSIFLKAGLTLVFIHVATLELWFLTPSAAFLTVSISSPTDLQPENCTYTFCVYAHTRTHIYIKKWVSTYPFVISLSPHHLARCYGHLPNLGKNR